MLRIETTRPPSTTVVPATPARQPLLVLMYPCRSSCWWLWTEYSHRASKVSSNSCFVQMRPAVSAFSVTCPVPDTAHSPDGADRISGASARRRIS